MGRYVQWRAGVQWYLFVLLGIPALIFLGWLALPGAPGALRLPALALPISYVWSFVLTFLFGGPLLEEPGWRGFALPRLQQAHGPLVGSLILDIFWALWHVPLFVFWPGYDGAGSGMAEVARAFLVFALLVAAITVIFTWIFNHTSGSLLLVMLAHASLNTSFGSPQTFLPGFGSLSWVQNATWLGVTMVFLALALLLVEVTRGRLGYRGQEPGMPAR